ncbi:MAG TPA: hypothetical protein VEJ38_05400 [Candidatus Acidoferrales bacterium]|nr:hypothetical protein [Candidatus Acidoferrales bacterium]
MVSRVLDNGFNSTYVNIDLIEIADGPNDKTAPKLGGHSSGIRFITQNYGDPSAAEKRGMEAALSELVAPGLAARSAAEVVFDRSPGSSNTQTR